MLGLHAAGAPSPDAVLTAIASAGYDGTELGPRGYLGDAHALRFRLERNGLALAGAYVALSFTQPRALEEGLGELGATLDLLEAAGERDARIVLADAGPRLRSLDEPGARLLADGISRAAGLARARGFRTAFHHHLGTAVETPGEVERVLELTDVPLALDTGHLVLGGGDPVRALADWGGRVEYVHLKDARRGALDPVLAGGGDLFEALPRGVFCELGAGDVELEAFLHALGALAYAGWVVVEQDRVPGLEREVAEAQARNRRWLAERGGV